MPRSVAPFPDCSLEMRAETAARYHDEPSVEASRAARRDRDPRSAGTFGLFPSEREIARALGMPCAL